MTIPGMELSETDGHIFLTITPTAAPSPTDEASVIQWLQAQGYGTCQLDQDAIAQAVQSHRTADAQMVFEIGQRLDALISVEVASDAMSATLHITPAQGGTAARPEQVLQALAQARVRKGIDLSAIALALAQPHTVVIARGQPPEHGQDAQFEALVTLTAQRTPQVNEEGRIDYREVDNITMVSAGAPLLRRIPPTPGIPGYTVRGDLVPAQPGTDIPFASECEGVQISAADPNFLESAIAGQPVAIPYGMQVDPVLVLPGVDISTGNIRFTGSVRIDGDIGQQMTVQADGDIIVRGTIDGGLVQAGGQIQVTGGVIGHAQVQAQGDIQAKFAEASVLKSGAALDIRTYAMDCTLQALQTITIGQAAPRNGRLIGGSATALLMLTTPILGSDAASLTHLCVGTHPEFEERCSALQQTLQKHETTLSSLRKILANLTEEGDPKGLLPKVQTSLAQAQEAHASLVAQREALQAQRALARQAYVQVGVGVHGAVDLWLCRRRLSLHQDFANGRFEINDEGIPVFIDRRGYADVLA